MQPIVEMTGIVKRFPGVLANDHVDFTLYPGEAHEEAAQLSGRDNVEDAAVNLRKFTNGIVVIKAGPLGCYLYDEGPSKIAAWFDGFRVPVRDTIGAGDSFFGAFMHAWLSGWNHATSAIFANAAGAVKTSKPGSGRQVPTFREIADLLENNGHSISKQIRQQGFLSHLELDLIIW